MDRLATCENRLDKVRREELEGQGTAHLAHIAVILPSQVSD